jgi:hypothetical protein
VILYVVGGVAFCSGGWVSDSQGGSQFFDTIVGPQTDDDDSKSKSKSKAWL